MTLLFWVQEHRAQKAGLHWELRLEFGGCLKSWVLKKDPPLRTHVKRLAIPVVDHAIGWGGFEGIITSAYGAGTVKQWDLGDYYWISTPYFPLTCQVFITIQGTRLQGIYSFLPYNDKYLFFKVSDGALCWQNAASGTEQDRR